LLFDIFRLLLLVCFGLIDLINLKRFPLFRYFGTKSSTVDEVFSLISDHQSDGTFADAFGGLGTIGSRFKSQGYSVTTCDVLSFPHAFQVSRIECDRNPSYKKLKFFLGIKSSEELTGYLNSLSSRDSWFMREYSEKRQFFTIYNASRISAIWNAIRHWQKLGLLTKKELCVLMASLLNSMDKVANTAGTYYAYLKNFDRKAKLKFSFEWIQISTEKSKGKGTVYLGDALEQLSDKYFDVLYLDPPYNRRNYSNYYHLPETLAKLKTIKLKNETKSGVPYRRHEYNENIAAAAGQEYISRLISNVEWKYLVFHYSDEGVIPLDNVRSMLRSLGDVEEHSVSALGYTTKQQARSMSQNLFIVSNA